MATSLPTESNATLMDMALIDNKSLSCLPSEARSGGKKKKNKRKKDDVEQDGEQEARATGTIQNTSQPGEQPKKKKKHKKKHLEGGAVDQALEVLPSAKEDVLAKLTDSKTKEAAQTLVVTDEKKEESMKKKKQRKKTNQLDNSPALCAIPTAQKPSKLESSMPKAKDNVNSTPSTCLIANDLTLKPSISTSRSAPAQTVEVSRVMASAPATEVVKANAAPRIETITTLTAEPDGLTKKKKKKDKKDKNLKKDSEAPKTNEPVARSQPATTPTPTPTPTVVSHADIQKFVFSNKITYEPPGIVSEFPPVLNFEGVKVNEALRKAFISFKNPSPIQSSVWPVLMAGRDVVGIAETGSGKTLAFGVPALQHVLDKSKPSKDSSSIDVLVIAPTRELAMQTESTLSELGKLVSPPIKSLCVYGGVDKGSQRKALARGGGIRVVAGTPGRLLDLANEGHLKLDQVSWLVLDEADRMLDKGFENDIRAIIALCLPSRSQNGARTRLTAMFSATWPLSVRRLAADFMRDPVRILVGEDELTASCSVEQTVQVLDESRGKEWKLLSTLNDLYKEKANNNKKAKNEAGSKDKIIVFALYKKEAQRLHQFLIRKGFEACCIEGDMSQDKRSQSLEDFKKGKSSILVATDVAARGLDIPKVEVVINVTFPLTIEDYIHRIGRTGRAGRTGKSITFFTDEDKAHAGELMRVLKDAGQTVPEDLKQWGGQIKKKTHAAYGDHWKDIDPTVKATKIKFD